VVSESEEPPRLMPAPIQSRQWGSRHYVCRLSVPRGQYAVWSRIFWKAYLIHHSIGVISAPFQAVYGRQGVSERPP
jgi:hypothetical protein